MKRLSLCMIVKDEIDGLGRCLDSVSGLVHEVVIVDTGSRDGTVELALERADKFAQIQWNNHFADARNASLELATGEWVLVLDGDEVLADGHQEVATAIGTPHLLAAELKIRNDLGGGKVGEFWGLRLFRNHPNVRWTGRIHEQVLPDIQKVIQREPQWSVVRLEARIDHGGYRPEIMERKSKTERNVRMLQEAIDELASGASVTKRAYLEYKLAAELGSTGVQHLFDAAERLLKLSRQDRRRFGLSAEVLVSASQEWCRRGDAQKAMSAGVAAKEIHPGNAMVSLVCAQASLESGEPSEARKYASESRANAGSRSEFHYDVVGHDIALSLLEAKIDRLCGVTDTQKVILQDLCARHPANALADLTRLRVFMELGEARTVLVDGLQHMKTHGASSAALLLCADAAEALGMSDKALSWRRLASGI